MSAALQRVPATCPPTRASSCHPCRVKSDGRYAAFFLGFVFLALVVTAKPVSAHTGFESSSPADGSVIDEPVSEITLTFTGEAIPAGDGFVVFDPSGTIRQPDDISTSDNLTWTLRFDEPLAGGDVGVRWMVAAPDTHPINGSLSFTITAPASTSTDEPAPTSTDEPAPAEQVVADPAATVAADLEDFLDTDDLGPTAASAVAALARILSVIGAVLAIGGVSFAAFGLRGDPTDVRAVLYWVRRGGALLIVGAIAEAATLTANRAGEWSALTSPTNLADALWSSAGVAVGLRFAGGLLATSETNLDTTVASTTGDPMFTVRQLATVGSGHNAPPPSEHNLDEPFVYTEDRAWDHRLSLGALIGVALVATSFMFDGHTASEGPRLLHAAANLTHVTTAAIWSGGVAMLALTIRRRHHDARPTRALQLAMRFSVIATFALVAAGIAGVALSIFVVNSISDLWTTPWGRLLSAKVTLVSIAGACGAYNHRVLLRELEHAPDDQATIDRFRIVVAAEATALLVVVLITAFLIAAPVT